MIQSHTNHSASVAAQQIRQVQQYAGLLTRLAVWAALSCPAWAQFRLDIQDVAENAFRNHAVQLDVAAGPVRGMRIVMMKPEQFERFLFRQHRSEEATIEALEEQLEVKIEWCEESMGLDGAQIEKLRLAGRGDIDAMMFRFEQLRIEFGGNVRNQEQLLQLVQKTQPLQNQLNGQVFGAASIFGRVSNKLLRAEQKVQRTSHESRKLRLFYEGAVNTAIAKIDRLGRLQEVQRAQIKDLLTVKVMLPRIENFSTRNGGGKYMVTYALYQLGRRKADLSGILGQEQMRAVEPLLVAAEQKEETLRREGYLK